LVVGEACMRAALPLRARRDMLSRPISHWASTLVIGRRAVDAEHGCMNEPICGCALMVSDAH
jgi:hypothetical protein